MCLDVIVTVVEKLLKFTIFQGGVMFQGGYMKN